ncbi:cell division protein FtsL [Pseudogemmobacter sonorensis]|uniref:cell division protein FtsL n=1 Tax=Pseudogemmobacter sonorensis TaxID=2989681 RepID=UPI0036B8DE76
MRPVLYVLTFLSLIALGFWAYRENYTTQAALREVRALQREITGLREALSVQKAEWAYLNRPDRLRELAGLNFDALGLMPMEPEQFGTPGQVVFPVPEIPAIELPEGALEDIATTASGEEEGL